MNRRSLLLAAGATTLSACASTFPRARGFALTGDLDAAIERALARLELAPGLGLAVYTRDGV